MVLKLLMSGSTYTPFFFFLKTILFAFCISTGTSASSSESKSSKPNCRTDQFLKFSNVPSRQSLQESVNKFPTTGEVSILVIGWEACCHMGRIDLRKGCHLFSIWIGNEANYLGPTLKPPFLDLLFNFFWQFSSRPPKQQIKHGKHNAKYWKLTLVVCLVVLQLSTTSLQVPLLLFYPLDSCYRQPW